MDVKCGIGTALLMEQSVTLIEQSGFVMSVLLEYFCGNHYLDFFSVP